MNKKLVCAVLLFFISSYLYATKYAGEFFDTGGGARALAMGRAFVAVQDDPSLGYWNPSLLPTLQDNSILLMHSERFGGDVKYDFATVNFKYNDSYISLTLLNTLIDDIVLTDAVTDTTQLPDIKGKTRDIETGAILSYGIKYNDKLNFGAGFKMARKSVADSSAYGLGLDLSATYFYNEKLTLAINIQNIMGTYLFWNNGTSEVLWPQVKLGAAYDFSEYNVLITSDLDIRFEGREEADAFAFSEISIDPHVGLEYALTKNIFLRAGYDVDKITYGAGLEYKKFRLNYGYIDHSDLDATQRISFSYSF